MSTCMGAPPPHDNCPHGRNCDWGRTAPPPPPPTDYECCASGSCEVCGGAQGFLRLFGKGSSQ